MEKSSPSDSHTRELPWRPLLAEAENLVTLVASPQVQEKRLQFYQALEQSYVALEQAMPSLPNDQAS
ncbi:hypothetical protein IWQ62_005882 [Dispira parvispora]|uniref:Uncharacterized protein n=1 Tax=Dispira parvispora TaxID=1520584 RepID=A0A9W8AHU6_9FUNG|nr:hypothetical protein IWQ62_005882 [Dispira parvispora]